MDNNPRLILAPKVDIEQMDPFKTWRDFFRVDVGAIKTGTSVTRLGEMLPFGLLFTSVGENFAQFLGYLEVATIWVFFLVKFGRNFGSTVRSH